MNYEIVRLKDVDNFVTDAAVAVNNFTKLKPEDEIYKESSYFWPFTLILEFFYAKYKKYVINVDNRDEIEDWKSLFLLRFINRLPVLYGRQKAFTSEMVQKVNENTLNNSVETDTKSGINSSDYAINTEWEKFGQLMRTDIKNNAKNVYQNMDATFKYAVDLYTEKWLESFNDLFIFYHESERRW